MKGIVFTLDAIFALVIATAALSVLIYFSYQAPTATLLSYSEAQSVLNALLGTHVAALSSTQLASQIISKDANMDGVWPQLGGSEYRDGASSYGPQSPGIAYGYVSANDITTGIVADYGRIYFGASDDIVALNSTFGSLAWQRDMHTGIASTPALSDGMVLFANVTNVTAVSALSGATVWSFGTANVVTTPMLAYDGYTIFGSTDDDIHAYYTSNGVAAWSASVGSTPIEIAISEGSMAVETSSGEVITYAIGGTAAVPISTVTSAVPITPSLLGYSGLFVFGDGTNADAILPSGNTVYSDPLAVQANGVAASDGIIVYQTSAAMYAFSPSGTSLWATAVPSYFGSAPASATPAIGGQVVYSLWSNGWLAAQNLSTGAILWADAYPYAITDPNMSLAYGNLYLHSGGVLTAFGACPAVANATVLGAASTLYLNGQGSCATALVSSVSPMYNYSIFINGSFAPGIQVANFTNAKGYIALGNSSTFQTNAYTWSFWIDPSSWPGSDDGVMVENCLSPGCPYMIEIPPQNILFSDDDGATGYTVNASVSLNAWQNVVGTYDYVTGNTSIYVDGVRVDSANALPVLSRTTTGYMLLGYQSVTPSADQYYFGKMANVQVYGSVLSQHQILQLYDDGIQGSPLGGAVAWYPLEGGADDYAGFNNTGYIVGGVDYMAANYIPSGMANAFQLDKASVTMPVEASENGGPSRLYDVGVYSWR